jgi:hypothetical protein
MIVNGALESDVMRMKERNCDEYGHWFDVHFSKGD